MSIPLRVRRRGTVIVGFSGTSPGGQAFRWTAESGMVGLGDLPGGDFFSQANGVSADGSVVVGFSLSENGQEAYRWTEAEGMVGLGDLPGGLFVGGAHAVSGDGDTVVGVSYLGAYQEAFRWTPDGGMVGLGHLSSTPDLSSGDAVSADGSLIGGWSRDDSGDQAAFVWDDMNGMRPLQLVLESAGVDLTGWTLRNVLNISDDGETLVGWGTNPSGVQEAFIATLPEPEIVVLLVLGLLGASVRGCPARRRSVESMPKGGTSGSRSA